MAERDLFANFDRMRREMDELFGDVFERTGLSRRRTGPWPAVDVAYASDPPRAIVTAELAGIEVDELALRIEGRKLILAGRRGPARPEGEVYQQVEIERGQFRRVIELGAEVRADEATARYEDGMLQVELPLVQRPPRAARGPDRERRAAHDRSRRSGRRRAGGGRAGTRQLPDQIAVLPLRDTVTFPDMLIPLNIGQERSVELVNEVLRGDRSIVMVAGRNPEVEAPGPRRALRGRRARRRGADDPAARRVAAGPDPGRPARADRGLGADRALPGGRGRRGARRGRARAPSWWR